METILVHSKRVVEMPYDLMLRFAKLVGDEDIIGRRSFHDTRGTRDCRGFFSSNHRWRVFHIGKSDVYCYCIRCDCYGLMQIR